MATEPPAGIVAGVGEEGAGAGLVLAALGIGLEAMVLERGKEHLVDADGIVTATMMYTDTPGGPVADPEYENSCQQPEEHIGDSLFPAEQHGLPVERRGERRSCGMAGHEFRRRSG